MMKVSGPHHESCLARVSAAGKGSEFVTRRWWWWWMNLGNQQLERTQVSPVCRVPKIRAPMLRASLPGSWIALTSFGTSCYRPKSWITTHHTACKIEGRLNVAVSEILVCFGNAGTAFAHAEVLGPLVSLDWTNTAKNDQSAFAGIRARRVSHPNYEKSQLLLCLSDNSPSLRAHCNRPQ
jgi:hypothetical protein